MKKLFNGESKENYINQPSNLIRSYNNRIDDINEVNKMTNGKTTRGKYTKPMLGNHFGNTTNSQTFNQAYNHVNNNPTKSYRSTGGVRFRAKAIITQMGIHKGQPAILFISVKKKRESARSYKCCWGHRTNCNATHIDIYTTQIR